MGYNGNHRKPYNVWKPSLYKRGARMLFPKPRKPRCNIFKQYSKTTRATFPRYTYKLPSGTKQFHTGKVQPPKESTFDKICEYIAITFAFLLGIGIAALVVWFFGWTTLAAGICGIIIAIIFDN